VELNCPAYANAMLWAGGFNILFMHYLIKFKRKGTKSKRFEKTDDAVEYMNGKDFTMYEIWKVRRGERIRIPFKTSNLSGFKNQLINA